MSEIEIELQEKKLSDFEINIKRILGFVSMLPYILIGFIEMFNKHIRADDNFKQNMMYLGAIGLFYFFSKEIIGLVNLAIEYRKNK